MSLKSGSLLLVQHIPKRLQHLAHGRVFVGFGLSLANHPAPLEIRAKVRNLRVEYFAIDSADVNLLFDGILRKVGARGKIESLRGHIIDRRLGLPVAFDERARHAPCIRLGEG